MSYMVKMFCIIYYDVIFKLMFLIVNKKKKRRKLCLFFCRRLSPYGIALLRFSCKTSTPPQSTCGVVDVSLLNFTHEGKFR